MSAWLTLLRRDLSLALRSGIDNLMAVMFFLLSISLFPLAVGPEPLVLGDISGGVIWVAALLSSMLTLEQIFLRDHQDGSIDLLRLSPLSMEAVALVKIAAHWIVSALPLVIIAPLLAVMMHMPEGGYKPLMLGLLLGTPVMSLIGGIGSALVLDSKRGGILLALLVLPLYIPVLIFGVTAIEAGVSMLPYKSHLLIVAAMLAAALPLAPLAGAAALRLSMR